MQSLRSHLGSLFFGLGLLGNTHIAKSQYERVVAKYEWDVSQDFSHFWLQIYKIQNASTFTLLGSLQSPSSDDGEVKS